MKLPRFQRKHLRYLFLAIVAGLLFTFIWLNFDYSRINLLGLFSFWLPDALIWALFFFGGCLVGYLFCRREKRWLSRKNKSF